MKQLQPLPFSVDALEPHIDAITMQIHYGKHHNTYYEKYVSAIDSGQVKKELSLKEVLKNISKYDISIRNNGGGHYNHSMFWSIMSPTGGGKPQKKISELINITYGSFDNFKNTFRDLALKRFGSGWVWFYINKSGIRLCSTANQDNTLMDLLPEENQGTPLLCLDVWEHAYYLKYKNERAKYVEAFWNVVNWQEVELRYNSYLDTEK